MLWSEDHFGQAAADRYASLIAQALTDVCSNPKRPGARLRLDLSPGAYIYHLISSRNHVSGSIVKRPRHFILYRILNDTQIEFARILRDSSDLSRHVPPTYLTGE